MRGNFLTKLKLIPTKTKQGLILIQKSPTSPFFDDHKENNLSGSENNDEKQHFEEQEFNFKATPTTTIKSPSNTSPKVSCIKEFPSLNDFEEKCPPGGTKSIILYTTSLRGIRKTFQDCNTIRFLLRNLRILYHERDVSLHLEYREELWNVLGGKVIPPKLFIKGRYIGGADEVIGLHEMGWLGKILEGTPNVTSDCVCIGCANMGFTICSTCCGSCKIFTNNECFLRCHECNENGLVKCHICC